MSEALIYGVHAVSAALQRRRRISGLWLDRERRDQRLEQVVRLAAAAGVAVEWTSRDALDRMVPAGRHQGVVARAAVLPPMDEADLERLLLEGRDEPPLLLILDGVQDPHNLGACLRSADAAGAHAVIAPRDRACGLTPVVRKVASGAAEVLPFIQVTNLARTLRTLRSAGVWVFGTAADAPGTLYQADMRGSLALVLGGEGSGMRRLTRENCDQLVSIPMRGSAESLNVSVAAGVCLFEAVRQRLAAHGE